MTHWITHCIGQLLNRRSARAARSSDPRAARRRAGAPLKYKIKYLNLILRIYDNAVYVRASQARLEITRISIVNIVDLV